MFPSIWPPWSAGTFSDSVGHPNELYSYTHVPQTRYYSDTRHVGTRRVRGGARGIDIKPDVDLLGSAVGVCYRLLKLRPSAAYGYNSFASILMTYCETGFIKLNASRLYVRASGTREESELRCAALHRENRVYQHCWGLPVRRIMFNL